MFERFTQDARRVVVGAQDESRRLHHDEISDAHLLIALWAMPNGASGEALAATGVTADQARDELAARLGRGRQRPSGHIPFTPDAKATLELALRQALDRGHRAVDGAHLLLGLLELQAGHGHELLTALGVDRQALRERTVALLDANPPPPEEAAEAVEVGRRVVGTVRPTGQPANEPHCGNCLQPLAGAVRVTTLVAEDVDAPSADEMTNDTAGINVRVAWCTSCGATIGTVPD